MPPAPIMFCGTTNGLPGMCFANVARNEPRLQVIFPADSDPDQHIDTLAAIEVRDRLCVRRPYNEVCQQQANARHCLRSRHGAFSYTVFGLMLRGRSCRGFRVTAS